MKKIVLVIAGMLFFLITNKVANAQKISLLCTGTESLSSSDLDTYERSPYAFKADIDLDTKNFTIKLEQDMDGIVANYPTDNPWNKDNCPTPAWKVRITDTEIQIITACDDSYKYPQVWDIKRTDGSFDLIFPGVDMTHEAKGVCVKSTEKAF